jgi:hypothetical protein
MEQKEMFNRLAFVVMVCAFGCWLIATASADNDNLGCIDIRPHGRLTEKHVVFEKDGNPSTDLFVLLEGFDPAAGTITAFNNARRITIKLSDWTALRIERVLPNPAAQTAPPALSSTAQVDITASSNDITVENGLISLSRSGCAGKPPDQGPEEVFLGKIAFEPTGWHFVGKLSTFNPPAWHSTPSTKPGA